MGQCPNTSRPSQRFSAHKCRFQGAPESIVQRNLGPFSARNCHKRVIPPEMRSSDIPRRDASKEGTPLEKSFAPSIVGSLRAFCSEAPFLRFGTFQRSFYDSIRPCFLQRRGWSFARKLSSLHLAFVVCKAWLLTFSARWWPTFSPFPL